MKFFDELGQVSGISSFMKLRYAKSYDELVKIKPDVVIVGVPLDDGQGWKTGSRFGPRAIRNSSTYFCTKRFHLELDFDYFHHISAVDYGDVKVFPGYIEKSQKGITDKIKNILKINSMPISIGGDHSITYPIIKAFKEGYNKKLGLIQVDAHLDLRPGVKEGKYTNGIPMRGIIDDKLVEPENLVQIGIRDFAHKLDLDFAQERNIKTFTMMDVKENVLSSILEEALENAWDGVDGVYLTFDIDSLDPSCAPGTGSPTFGGFSSSQALEIVRTIAKEGIVGFDIVEVIPSYDLHDITSTLAARIIVEVLAALSYRNNFRSS